MGAFAGLKQSALNELSATDNTMPVHTSSVRLIFCTQVAQTMPYILEQAAVIARIKDSNPAALPFHRSVGQFRKRGACVHLVLGSDIEASIDLCESGAPASQSCIDRRTCTCSPRSNSYEILSRLQSSMQCNSAEECWAVGCSATPGSQHLRVYLDPTPVCQHWNQPSSVDHALSRCSLPVDPCSLRWRAYIEGQAAL